MVQREDGKMGAGEAQGPFLEVVLGQNMQCWDLGAVEQKGTFGSPELSHSIYIS